MTNMRSDEITVLMIDAEGAGRRIDAHISELLPSLSRSRVQSLIAEGKIQVNGQPTKSSRKLDEGDQISCEIPAPVEMDLTPVPMELEIIYEDEYLLVINKPKGLVVHPAPGSGERTLVHGLLAHCTDLSGINGVQRPGIVHRLDKDTSGLIVVAKTDEAHHSLANQLQERKMKREYLAVVRGIIVEGSGIIDVPIARDSIKRKQMEVSADGRSAQTGYRVLDRLINIDNSVVLCELHSGRTHQIRVHFKYLGYPVVGDPKYGRRKDDPRWSSQALHAWHLAFAHPVHGEQTDFYSKPPQEFMNYLIDENAKNTLSIIKNAVR